MPHAFPLFRSQFAEFKVYWDVCVRAAFCLYYLPVIALAVALTHSCLQSTVYVLVIPTLRRLEEISVCMMDTSNPITPGGTTADGTTVLISSVLSSAPNGSVTSSSVSSLSSGPMEMLFRIYTQATATLYYGHGGSNDGGDSNATSTIVVGVSDLMSECGVDAWDAHITAWSVIVHQRGLDLFTTAHKTFTFADSDAAIPTTSAEIIYIFTESVALQGVGILAMSASVVSECLKLCLVLLPQACIAMSAVVVGHKLIKGLTEAMVDSYSRLEDGKDYPLLAARLRFVTHSRRRWLVLMVVLTLGLLTVGVGMLLDSKDRFAKGHVEVAAAIWFTSTICGTYIIVSAFHNAMLVLRGGDVVTTDSEKGNKGSATTHKRRRFQLLPPPDQEWNRYAFAGRSPNTQTTIQPHTTHPPTPIVATTHFSPSTTSIPLTYYTDTDGVEIIPFSTFFTGVWWRGHIHRVRHLAMALLLTFAGFWVITDGPMTSIIRSTELMMFLNIPHIFGFLTLTISSSVIYKLHSVWWCLRHWRSYGSWIMLAMIPHAVMIGYAIIYVMLGYTTSNHSSSSSSRSPPSTALPTTSTATTATTVDEGTVGGTSASEGSSSIGAGRSSYYVTLSVLSSMLMLLFFKAVQLAREFDVMPKNGRVRWIEVLPVLRSEGEEREEASISNYTLAAVSSSSPSMRAAMMTADVAHPARYPQQHPSVVDGFSREVTTTSADLVSDSSSDNTAVSKSPMSSSQNRRSSGQGRSNSGKRKGGADDHHDDSTTEHNSFSESSNNGDSEGDEEEDIGSSFVSPSTFDIGIVERANSATPTTSTPRRKRSSWRDMLSRTQYLQQQQQQVVQHQLQNQRRPNSIGSQPSSVVSSPTLSKTHNSTTAAIVNAMDKDDAIQESEKEFSASFSNINNPASRPHVDDVASILSRRICRPVPPSYAVALEDAYERRQEEVGVVGLDISVSVAKMELYRRGQVVPSSLLRLEVSREEAQRDRLADFKYIAQRRYGAGVLVREPIDKTPSTSPTSCRKQQRGIRSDNNNKRRHRRLNGAKATLLLSEVRLLKLLWQMLLPLISNSLRSRVLTLETLFVWVDTIRMSYLYYALPRLLFMNASDNLSGRRFSNARMAIKTFVSTLIIIFLGLTVAIVAQTSFPFLHPAPVTVSYFTPGFVDSSSALQGETMCASDTHQVAVIDHLLLRLEVRGVAAPPPPPSDPEEVSSTHQPPATGASTPSVSTGREYEDDDDDDLYPDLCKAVYGNNISVFEMAWFALIPYLPHEEDMSTLLVFLNNKMGTRWRIVTDGDEDGGTDSNASSKSVDTANSKSTHHHRRRHNSSTGSKKKYGYLTRWQGFVDFYCPDRDTHVVSVRGTDLTSSLDMVQDINMFFEAAFFQVVSSVVPGASLLPTSLVTDFIKLSSLTDTVSESSAWSFLASSLSGAPPPVLPQPHQKQHQSTNTHQPSSSSSGAPHRGSGVTASKLSIEREYYLQVLAYVERLQQQHQRTKDSSSSKKGRGGKLLLTGHSLGGSIAHVVASRSGTRSIGFNNPGVVLAHKKFGIPDVSAIHRLTTSILATHDLVPLIGWQGGAMHHVECGAQMRELCHAMEFMVASLWRSCGSIRRRYPNITSIE